MPTSIANSPPETAPPKTAPTEVVLLRHTIPFVGAVEVPLHGLAAKIYKNLESQGEISRLQKLNQLGALQAVYPGAHHTRWDFVLLQLFLIKLLRNNDQTLGLNRNIPITADWAPSKLELIQSYVFLRNFGHLAGTFAAERLFLESLSQSATARKIFIEGLPADFQSLCDATLTEERVSDIHKWIALYLLNNPTSSNLKNIKERAAEVFRVFNLHESRPAVALRELHNITRRLSYISLDLQFSGAEVNINLTSIISRPDQVSRDLFRHGNSSLHQTIDFLEGYLTDRVYRTADALWAVKHYKEQYLNSMNRHLAQASSTFRLSDSIKHFKNLKQGNCTATKKPPHFDLNLSEDASFRELYPITRESDLALQSGIPQSNIARSWDGKRVYAYFNAKNRGDATKIINGALRLISKPMERSELPGEMRFALHERNTTEIAVGLVRALLSWLSRDRLEVLMGDAGSGIGFWGSEGKFCISLANARRTSLTIVEQSKMSPLDADALAEVELLHSVVSTFKYGRHFVLFPNRIKFQRKPLYAGENRNPDVGEFDGAILISNKRHVRLLLLESKNSASSQTTTAKKALKKKISELGWDQIPDIKVGLVTGRGAFLQIDFK